MTISTSQISVGTVATLIAGPDEMPQRVILHNNEASQQVFVGNGDVTTANGLHVDGKEEQVFTLNPGESLYGVCAIGTNSVSVMIQRQ